VAILAQLRNSLGQQPFVGAAMYRVAGLAILFHRRVDKYRWATFIGMAFETQLPGIVGVDHIFTHAAVRGMTRRAFNFSLNYRMMRPLIGFNLDIIVTAEAHLGFPGFLPATDMQVMAGIAGHIVTDMGSHTPQVHTWSSFVASQAFCRFFNGIDIFVEGKDIHTATTALFHVLGPRTMAGLASILGLGSFYGLLEMHRFRVALVLLLMTIFTGFRPDKTQLRIRFLGGRGGADRL
jgi:hypothetical protein